MQDNQRDMGASANADQATQASPGAAEASPPFGECPSRKVVINACHGGFDLCRAGVEAYAKHKGIKLYEAELYPRDIRRDDPALVATVEDMGAEAGGKYSKLRVVEIPADVEWTIEEYDGLEWVAEAHRTWN